MQLDEERITLEEFLAKLAPARSDWEELLSQIPEERMTQSGAAGEWSVKDILAHVAWFEREMVGMLRARALAGSDLWILPRDERNAAIYQQNKGRSLEDVLKEAEEVFIELDELLRGLTDEELKDPGQFKDMPPDWIPWQILAQNTYEHYRDHEADVRRWLVTEKPDDL